MSKTPITDRLIAAVRSGVGLSDPGLRRNPARTAALRAERQQTLDRQRIALIQRLLRERDELTRIQADGPCYCFTENGGTTPSQCARCKSLVILSQPAGYREDR